MEQITPIHSFRNICRLCLGKNQTFVDIFSFSSNLKRDIVDVLVACVPIHISVYDDLPRTICISCSIMVEEFHKFQQLAVKSERTLHSYLNSSEPKDVQLENYDDNNVTQEEIKTEPVDIQNNTTQTNLSCNQHEVFYNEQPEIKTEPTDIENNTSENHSQYQSNPHENYHQYNKTYPLVHHKRVHSKAKFNEEPLIQQREAVLEKSNERAGVNCRPSVICNQSINQELVDQELVDQELVDQELVDQELVDQNDVPDQQRKTYQVASEEVNKHGACEIQINQSVQQAQEATQLVRNKNIDQNLNISYRCVLCLKCFTTKDQLVKHKRSHEKFYTCYICNTCFSHKNHLIKHKCIDLYCKICSLKFKNERSLNIHHSSMHSDQIKIQNTKSKLIPAGDKHNECEVCNRVFANKIDFLTHKSMHKQYGCKICSMHFTKKSNLTTHAKVHFGERPHMCDICNKSFSQHVNLVAHKQTHK